MNGDPPSECYSITMKEPFLAASLNVLRIALASSGLQQVSLIKKNSVKLNFLKNIFFLAFYRTKLELAFSSNLSSRGFYAITFISLANIFFPVNKFSSLPVQKVMLLQALNRIMIQEVEKKKKVENLHYFPIK